MQCDREIKIIFINIEIKIQMSNNQLIDTIRMQRQEILRLKEDLSTNNSTIYQNKYKKALKDISTIIKANRELKEELDKLRSQQINDHQNDKQIQKEQFQKAYEKVLNEKNKMSIQIQNLNFEKEQLKYSVQSLEQYVAQLKSEQMSMAREKEALERTFNRKGNQNPQGNISKAALEDTKDLQILKQKQTEYLRRIQNYEEHHASLNKINRKLQSNIAELQAKLTDNQRNYQSIIQQKNNQLLQLKNNIQSQFQDQINSLKKQNANLKNQIHELTLSLQSYEQSNTNRIYEGEKQYELQLIETLKELKGQMQPLKIQISSINQNKQSDKESSAREKANMKMKIIELENKNQQTLANCKQLEKKLIMAHQKIRHYQDQQRLLKKLEEQNRILGGRVIVLESKDIALKNRSGQDLEEKVLEFQSRVQILLKDKQNISNMKNVTIHQLIALKAYIMELDAKLQAVVAENQYSHKKYKSYKQKYTNLAKEMKNHQNIVNAYQNKITAYDKLIIKMQGQLQRIMGMYDLELKSINFKTMQQQNSMSIQMYKKRYMALQEKLEMQDRYAKQQLQTIKLNYQTKLMEANIKMEQIKSLKQTIQLYKNKNDQLVNKLNKKDNQIFQLKLSFTQVKDTTPHEQISPSLNKYSQYFIQSLKNSVTQKQNIILRMQSDFRGLDEQWRRKYQRLQQQNQQFVVNIQANQIALRQVQNLHNQNYQLKNTVQAFKLQVNKKNGQLQTMSNQNKKYYSELNQLKTRVTTLDTHIINLQGINNQLKSQVSRYQSGYNDRQNLIQSKDQTIFQLNSQLRHYSSIIQQLNNQINNKHDKQYNLSNAYKQLQKRYQSRQEEFLLSESNTPHEQISPSLNKYSQYFIQSLKNSVTQKQNIILRMQSDFRGLDEQWRRKYQRLQQQNQQFVVNIQANQIALRQVQNLHNQNYQLKNTVQAFKLQVNKKNGQLQTMSNQNKKYYSELNQLKTRVTTLDTHIINLQGINNQLKSQVSRYQSGYNDRQNLIQSKDQTIFQLNSQLRHYSSIIQQLNNQINNKHDKQYNLSNAYKQLQKRYQSRQEEFLLSESNRVQISQQFMKLQQTFKQNQLENQQKNVEIVGLKNQLNSLREEIKNQLNEKNQQISRITQQLFTKNMEDERISKQEINKIEAQCYQLKNKLNSLGKQLAQKQNIIINLQQQIKKQRIEKIQNVTYSENDFSSLKEQINNLQININNLKHTISDHQFEKEQLENKISYSTKAMKDQKLQYQQQIKRLKNQIQQIIQRQKIINGENQQGTADEMKNIQQIKVGLLLYEKEVERLNKVVQELQQQIFQLRMRLTFFTNQQSRLQENLTTMALTFAEVQALRDRMIKKQKQISQVRNTLLGIGTSERNWQINQIYQSQIQRGLLPQTSNMSSGLKQQHIKYDWHSDIQPKNQKNDGDHILQSDKSTHNLGILRTEQQKQIRSRSLNRQQFFQFSQHSQGHPLQFSHYTQLTQPTQITQVSSQGQFHLQNALVPMQISQQKPIGYNLGPGKTNVSQQILVKQINESFINQSRTQPHIQFTHIPSQQNIQQNVRRVTTQGNKVTQQGWR